MSGVEGIGMMENMGTPLPPMSRRIYPDDPFPRPEPGTCPWPRYTCPPNKYRTFDGSCNNLLDPLRGRSFTPFERFVPPSYGDGKLLYRMMWFEKHMFVSFADSHTKSYKGNCSLDECLLYSPIYVMQECRHCVRLLMAVNFPMHALSV